MPVYGPMSFHCRLQRSSTLFHPLMPLRFYCIFPPSCAWVAPLLLNRGISMDDDGLCHLSVYHPLSLRLLAWVSSHSFTMPLPMKGPDVQNDTGQSLLHVLQSVQPWRTRLNMDSRVWIQLYSLPLALEHKFGSWCWDISLRWHFCIHLT